MEESKLIPFNIPHLTGNETKFIEDAVNRRVLSGNGEYTKLSQQFMKQRLGTKQCLLTTSCTDALEMCAILTQIEPGDEVIMPAYTFVSTANAFVLRGAKVVFVDSRKDHPGMDERAVDALVTPRTKAVIAVHYAGVACDMDVLQEVCNRHRLFLIEDAAQAIEATYKERPLGAIGHLGAFSFHETKNIISGEGGMLCVNDAQFSDRSEIIWEKGTNRAAFWRGEVDKYGWVDIGSSFLASDITAAFLYAQLLSLEGIQVKRRSIWSRYHAGLQPLISIGVQLPSIPEYASNNAHMFYLVMRSADERTEFIRYMKENKVLCLFHYLGLHRSKFYENKHDGRGLPNCDRYTNALVRLPLYYSLSNDDIDRVVAAILKFYKCS